MAGGSLISWAVFREGTARRWLRRDLETLLARASEIKQNKRRESIVENADKARVSKLLVTLKNDVEVKEGLDDLTLDPPDGPKLIAFLKTMEFSTLTRRVAEATGAEPADCAA